MKTAILVTVDVEAYILAKKKVDNVSGYLNECLKSLADSNISDGEESLEDQLKSLNNTLQDAKIKRDIVEMELQRKKELANDEKSKSSEFNRWKCPVCSKLNFLDSLRCSSCTLPSRNDPETIIVNIKEVLL